MQTNACREQAVGEVEKGNGKSRENLAQVRGRRFAAKDFVELSVLATYVVQKRGGATLSDVMTVITDDLNSKVHKNTLSKVMEALRSRDIVAANFGAGGDRVYSMKKIKFNCNIEIAHVNDLIPALMDDTAGIAIKQAIEGQKKDTKEKDRYPRLWADYTIEIELLSPWLGAQSIDGNEYLKYLYDQATDYNHTIPKDCDPQCIPLVFERNHQGALVIHAANVRGFLKTHLRSAGVSPFSIDHFYVQPVVVRPERLFVTKIPIIDPHAKGMQSRGKGLGFYEVIPAGTRIVFKFAAPTKNYISPDKMKSWLGRVLEQPSSSMSPARGRQYGAAKMISCDCSLWPEDQAQDQAQTPD